MPNRINAAMREEYETLFGDSPNLVAVDYRGLSVAEFAEFRNHARAQGIKVFVVKNAIAHRVLAGALERNGLESVLTGQTALVYGDAEFPDVARLVHQFGVRSSKLAIRGGIFERKVITPEDVRRFKDIPDRHTLLGQVLATIIAPLTGTLASVSALLRAPADLAEALRKKNEGGGQS